MSRFSAPFAIVTLILALVVIACTPADPPSSPTDLGRTAASGPSWNRVAMSEAVPTDRRLVVGFLVVDGVHNSELMAPYDIFQHTIFHHEHGMDVLVVSPDGQPVHSFEGLEIGAHHSFATAPDIDILVVPSAEHSMDSDLENEAMMRWVTEVGGRAHYLLSLCDGAFVLAATGLLDGRAATTFPGDQDAFAEKFLRSISGGESVSSTTARRSPAKAARAATIPPCTWSTTSSARRSRAASDAAWS